MSDTNEQNRWNELKHARARGNADNVWAGIEQELEGNRKRRPAFWLWYSAAATILLLIATSGVVYLMQSPAEESPSIAQTETEQVSPKSDTEKNKDEQTDPVESARVPEVNEEEDKPEEQRLTKSATSSQNTASPRPVQETQLLANSQTDRAEQQAQQEMDQAEPVDASVLPVVPDVEELADRSTDQTRLAEMDQPLTGSEDNGISDTAEVTLPAPPPTSTSSDLVDIASMEVPAVEAAPSSVVTTQKKERFGKSRPDLSWFAGAHFAPELAQINLQERLIEYDQAALDQPETRQSYTAGMQVGFSFHKRLDILAGVNFASWEGESEGTTQVLLPYTEEELEAFSNQNPGISINSLPERFTTNQLTSTFTLRSFEFPVVFRYKIWNRRMQYYVSSGLSTLLLVDYQRAINDERVVTVGEAQEETRLTQFNWLVSAGAEYQFARQLAIVVEPNLRMGIGTGANSVLEDPGLQLGLRTGVSYYFR